MNINDLSVLFAAVELAVKRGTFSVFEIGTVGQAAERLGAFLKDAAAQAEAAKAAQEAEQAAAEGQEAAPEAPAEQA
jgi:hypothetical protein